MTRDNDGVLSCSIGVIPGRRYQYRFLLDNDRWINDWTADAYAPNSFGGEDSVLDLTADVERVLAAGCSRHTPPASASRADPTMERQRSSPTQATMATCPPDDRGMTTRPSRAPTHPGLFRRRPLGYRPDEEAR
jgi:hypothetical protein